MRIITKLVLVVSVVIMATLGTKAQLVIYPNGNAHFGDTAVVDTTATIHIAGYGQNGSNGKIAFGNTNHGVAMVNVGEYQDTTNMNTDMLWLHGARGQVFSDSEGVCLRHIVDSPTGFNFTDHVSARSLYVATDPSLNRETSSVISALDLLSDLQAISYRLKHKSMRTSEMTNGDLGGDAVLNGDVTDGRDIEHPVFEETDSLHYGLTITSVQQTLPELVTEDLDGIKYVDYNSLIPLLVVAVNELKEQVDELLYRQTELESTMGYSQDAAAPQDGGNHEDDAAETDDIIDGLLKPALYQNIPNPFNADTQVRYRLPESVQQADLYVYDLQGKQVKRIPVTERGESSVTIHGSELQAGMYIYTLIADSQEIDSKRMILTK